MERIVMLKIAICDDNAEDSQNLKKRLESILNLENIDANLLVFSSGEQLIAYMQTSGVMPICFLDIYMKEVSGVDVARWIRQRDNTCTIVFTTTSSEHMAQGWEVGASHYLLKPFTENEVKEALTRCLRLVGYRGKYIELMVNRQPRKILLSDITYVESQNKHCLIYTSQNEELRVLIRLGSVEELLDDARFIRCHQSYIVNMDFVENVQEGDFVLPNTLVPIRRKNRCDIIRYYEDYCIEVVRRRV
ncbi:two-component system response regulator LytT [Lachnospiraceae bacterium PF1-22]